MCFPDLLVHLFISIKLLSVFVLDLDPHAHANYLVFASLSVHCTLLSITITLRFQPAGPPIPIFFLRFRRRNIVESIGRGGAPQKVP